MTDNIEITEYTRVMPVQVWVYPEFDDSFGATHDVFDGRVSWYRSVEGQKPKVYIDTVCVDCEPGDYICYDPQTGHLNAVKKKVFESAYKKMLPFSPGLKTPYCEKMKAAGYLTLEEMLSGPMRHWQTQQGLQILGHYKDWLETQLREQYQIRAIRELRETKEKDITPEEEAEEEGFGLGRMSAFEESYYNLIASVPQTEFHSSSVTDDAKQSS